MSSPRQAGTLLLLLGGTLACGKDPTKPRVPTTVQAVAGDGQTGPAGQALPQAIQFKVSDAQGPIPKVPVAFIVTGGGGSVSRALDSTNASGIVSVNWIIGVATGANILSAAVTGLTPGTATATGVAGPAAAIIPTAGNAQFAIVGHSVPIAPTARVTDAFGNPVSGVTVTFAVQGGGGSVTGATPISGADGRATLGSWTLGTGAGQNTLLTSVPGGVNATFTAVGTPATLTVITGNSQTVNAGTAVPILPAVQAVDGTGQPLAGVSVTFVVATGNGLVSGAAQTTAANGIATVGSWIVGLAPGVNQLRIQTPGLPAVTVSATGVAATPANLTAISPTSQTAFLGNFVTLLPRVRVTDAPGNPVAGQAVTFAIQSGGGRIVAGHAMSDFNGETSLPSWRVGPTDPLNTVDASVQGLPPVTFTVNAGTAPQPVFQIEVRYNGTPPTTAQKAAFDSATAKWGRIIIAHLPSVAINEPASSGGCYPALNETIQDLVIFANLVKIDGAGGVLGRAGPCLLRDQGFLTIVGQMEFDTDDLATLEQSGQLSDVITHEMGHVLGFGTIWDQDLLNLLTGRGSSDPFFTGPSAQSAFTGLNAPNLFYHSIPVPVENSGGAGTRDAHWRESILGSELMTGFLNRGTNPLSPISAAQFRDMGYVVNDAAADAYSFSAAIRAATEIPLRLNEAPMAGPMLVLNRTGRIIRAIPRK